MKRVIQLSSVTTSALFAGLLCLQGAVVRADDNDDESGGNAGKTASCGVAAASCGLGLKKAGSTLFGDFKKCKPVRQCKKRCRQERRDCKQVAKDDKKDCKQECKDKHGRGSELAACKKACREDKREDKQECKAEKRVCKEECFDGYDTNECRTMAKEILETGVGLAPCVKFATCVLGKEAE